MKTLNQNTNSEYYYESELFFRNSESIYNVAWQLALQVSKRMLKKLPVSFSHLAGCSTVKKIATMTNKECMKSGVKPLVTSKDFEDFRHFVATQILDWADFEARKIA